MEGEPEHGGWVILVIRHEEVDEILRGREIELIDLVRRAYLLHEEGKSAVPHSTFLRFPGDTANRVIGLPAFLGGDAPAAGMKWIASFPGNITIGVPRASAAILLNSLRNGRPEALIEGSQISAKRTAASAALAAGVLAGARKPTGVALIGCGVINYEALRFLTAELPSLAEVTVYDRDPARAAAFAERCGDLVPGGRIALAVDAARAVAAHDLVSIATTASEPHMDLGAARPGVVVLHVSLRDLYPNTILHSYNVVDDADHVCRERTSLHLAEMLTYRRDFVHAPIGQVLRDGAEFVGATDKPVVFSPFGLGVLDIALADFVRSGAEQRGLGVRVDGFLPGAVPTPAAH